MANQSEKIRSINSVGWDGVNSTVQPFKNKTEQNDLDIAFAKCFQTEAGQNVLKYSTKCTCDFRPSIPSHSGHSPS